MTELSPVCHVTPFDNIKYGSVGVLLPNLKCKVSTKPTEDYKLTSQHTIIVPFETTLVRFDNFLVVGVVVWVGWTRLRRSSSFI